MTTGAGNDFERVSELARRMVCEWGMSEEIGPLTFGKKEEQIFLGREIAQHQEYSEETAIRIDQEIKRVVMENYKRSRAMLEEHRVVLVKMAEELLLREVLDGDQVRRLAAGLPLDAAEHSADTPPSADTASDAKQPSAVPPLPPLNKPLPQE